MTFLHSVDAGWLGVAFGAVGIILAVYFYRRTILGARLVYQKRALRLIGKDKGELPAEVEIRFRGRIVERLTKTFVVLWNSGRLTVDGSQIVGGDPLRVEFAEGSEILEARVLRSTRPVNGIRLEDFGQLGKAVIAFEFLDAGDGAVLEFLHTSSERFPKILGSVKGIPKGISDWGRIRPVISSQQKSSSAAGFWRAYMTTVPYVVPIIGLGALVFGLYPRPSDSIAQPDRIFVIVMGAFNLFVGLAMIWASRRRFPKPLQIPELFE